MPSYYVPVHLSDEISPATVGVYVPERVKQQEVFDVIVYFHGNIIETCGTDPQKFDRKGIEHVWSTPNFTCLRDWLLASNKNAILIAPTLSKQFGSSRESWCPRYGNLQLHNQFDWLLQETLDKVDQLAEDSRLSSMRIGKVVLAAHSAGGMPMMRILQATNATRIDECWGFECLYFGTDAWTEWLRKNPDKMFHHFRRPGVFSTEALILSRYQHFNGLLNFRDTVGGTDHCSQVKTFWNVALADSHVLHDTPVPAPAPIVVAAAAPAAQTPAERRSFWDFVMSIGR